MSQVVRTDSGSDPALDTVRIPVLAELQQQFLSEAAAESGVDPYQSDGQRVVARERPSRRTLDDMRRLSETIKRSRASQSEPE